MMLARNIVRTLVLVAPLASVGLAPAVGAAPTQSLQLVIDLRAGVPAIRHAQPLARPATPLRATPRTAEDLFFRVTDASGAVLVEGWIDDPRRLRAPLPPPGEPVAGHAFAHAEGMPLVLRVPLAARMGHIELATSSSRWRLVVPDPR